MEKVDIVFVVLVYRNTKDIVGLLDSIEMLEVSYKVILVNSYYDQRTKDVFSMIAEQRKCCFLNIENKGYGYGNNQGIQYAKEHYDFQYIIVSNPDIVIDYFDANVLHGRRGEVIAPVIYGHGEKIQNPYWAKECTVAEYLMYYGYKKKKKVIVYTGIAINKLIRECFFLSFMHGKKNEKKVFAAHGSFVLLSKSVVDKLDKVYDENMFLFAEEAYLAHRLKEIGVSTILTKRIQVHHKEDGSIGLCDMDFKGYLRQSIVYYYEKYVKNMR